MRNAVIASAVLILILSLIIAFPADEGAHAEKRIRTEWEKEEFPGVHRDEGPHHLTSSAADVYCIAWYDFETLDWQGSEEEASAACIRSKDRNRCGAAPGPIPSIST